MTSTYETGYAQRLDEAADSDTSAWRLAVLADDPDPVLRMAVAANPSASAITILRLQRDDDARVRVAVSVRHSDGA